MEDDKRLVMAAKHLLTRVETDGVAVVTVRDGAVYAFSRKKLLELVQTCDESGQDHVIVMVKTGPTVDGITEN